MGLIDTLLAQLIADRDAMKSALNGILGVSVGDSMADYATPITTVGNQLEGMLGMNQEFSIDLTGSGLTKIRLGMFYETKIASVIIPQSVTAVGAYSFGYCTFLTSITIPNSVTSVGSFALQNCTALMSVSISHNITTISSYFLQNCRSLPSISIPSSITSIQAAAFSGCTSLNSITINATTPPTLANANAFDNTNNCPIYVPVDSVAAYKAASNWNSLSSRIQAIPT